MADTLRERLAAVMAGAVASLDPHRSTRRQVEREIENRTDEALRAVAAWLRDGAAQHYANAERGEDSTARTMLIIRADTIAKAADSITGSTDAD